MADLGSMISNMAQQPDSGQQIGATLQSLAQQMKQQQQQEQTQQMKERRLSMQESQAASRNKLRMQQIDQIAKEMDLTDMEMEQQAQTMIADEAQGLLNYFDEQGNITNPVAYERSYQQALERAKESGIDTSEMPEEAPADPTVLQQVRDRSVGAKELVKQAHDKAMINRERQRQLDVAERKSELRKEESRLDARLEGQEGQAEGVGSVTPASGREIEGVYNLLDEEGISLNETQRDIFAQDVADRARKLNEATDLGPGEARDLAYNALKSQRITDSEEGSWYNPISWVGASDQMARGEGERDIVSLFQRAKERYPNRSDEEIATRLRKVVRGEQ